MEYYGDHHEMETVEYNPLDLKNDQSLMFGIFSAVKDMRTHNTQENLHKVMDTHYITNKKYSKEEEYDCSDQISASNTSRNTDPN